MNVRRLGGIEGRNLEREKRQLRAAEVEVIDVLDFFFWPRYRPLPSDDTVIMWILFTKCIKWRSSCPSVQTSVHLSLRIHALSSKKLNRFRAVYNGSWGLMLKIVQWQFIILINAMRIGIIKPKRHLFARCVLSGVNCSFECWNDSWMMDCVGYWEKLTWITLKNHPRIFHEGFRKTTQDMWDLRCLQWYCWDSMYSGMWRRVVW
jgi:hypothetical protein